MIRNNVTRLLESRRIPFQTHEIPQEKTGAVAVAALLDVPAKQVFKTIVVTRPRKGKPILALVPGPSQVDLKALARALGEKKLHLPTERQAEALSGLQAGGISPLALLNRPFQVVIDESAVDCEVIYVSGGQRGLDISLAARDLIRLTKATTAPIAARSE